MKYAVISCINGNYKVEAEGMTEQGALVLFHDKCKVYWNASDVITGTVAIVDEKLNILNGDKKEYITHPAPQPEPTPSEEEPEEPVENP